MKFQYLADPRTKDTKGRMVKRPILILELTTKDGSILEVPALLDSGADRTNVNFQYADILGVKLGPACETIGVGDGRIEGNIGDFSFTIRNTPWKMTVPATYIKSKNVVVLLGREEFFDKFKIKFEQGHDTFELVEVK